MFIELSISAFLKLSNKILKLNIKHLKDQPEVTEVLHDFGLSIPEDNHKSLYLHSLIKFTHAISDKNLLEVFKHNEALNSFDRKNEYDEFGRSLNKILITDPLVSKNRQLKSYSSVPPKDIETFKKIYLELLEEVKTPVQVDVDKKIEDLNEKVSELQALLEKGNFGEAASIINRQIVEFESFMFVKLNFNTTNDFLKRFESLILNVSIPKDNLNSFLAIIKYLQGWCLYMLNSTENRKFFIQALDLDQSKLVHKEWGAISYFKIGEIVKAKELALTILEEDSFNSIAFAILKNIDEKQTVPQFVLKDPNYKQHFTSFYLRKDTNRSLVFNLFSEDFINFIPILKVENLEDFLFKRLLTSFYFEHTLMKYNANLSFSSQELACSSELENCIQSFGTLKTYVNESNDFNFVPYFADVSWLHSYCCFIKYFDKRTAGKIYEAFLKLPESFKEIRFEQTLFSLARVNHYELIIELDSQYKSKNKENNIFLAESYRIIKKDNNKAATLVKEYLKNLSKIEDDNLHNISIALEILANCKLDVVALFNELLLDKDFKLDDLKELLLCYAILLTNGNLQGKKAFLLNFSKKLSSSSDSIKLIVAILLNELKEHSKCNEILVTVPDYKHHPLALRLYIDNRLAVRENSSELLELFKNFRKFKVDIYYLKYEIELYLKLADYKSVSELSDIGLNCFSEISNFRYYKIIALYYLNDDINLSKYLNDSLFKDFKFN
jgi:hypothetical protein